MIIRNTSSVLIALLFIGLTHSHRKCRLPNGYAGECRHLEECRPLFNLNEKLQKTELDILYLQQSSCGTTSSFRYKVCCPPPSEWSKVLEVDPIMFPELIDYMSERGPTWGNKNTFPKATVTDRGILYNRPGQFATGSNVYGLNNGNSQQFGQTTNGQIASNSNGYAFDNNYSQNSGRYPAIGQTTWSSANAQGTYNDHTHKVAQTPFVTQTTWNANSNGFNNYQPQKGWNTPTIGQTTWSNVNTREPNNENTKKGTQTTFNGQTTWNANSDRFDNNPPHTAEETPTVGLNAWNVNIHGPNNEDTQRIGQNPFIDLTTIWNANNLLFNNNQPQGVGQTSSNNNPSNGVEITPSNGQITTSTSAPELNTDGMQNNDEDVASEQTTTDANSLGIDQRAGESTSNSPTTLNTNTSELDINQNDGDTPSDVLIALSSIGQESDKDSGSCGVQTAVLSSAVVGADTAPEQYPWLALLEYAGGVVSCGGSLISRKHVLTAAHCVETMRGKPTAVRLSEYNMSTYPVDVVMKDDGNSEVINVTVVPIEWSRMHPLFTHSHYQHDIGLVKMTQEMRYTDFIRPICLPQADYAKQFDVGTKLLVAGWGTDRWDVADVKTDNRVPFVPTDICHRLVKRAIGNKQLCAGERPTRKQCLGDYGGPLMFDTEEFYVAVGVISYGPQQCGDGAAPDVYTNVYEYMDWIKDNMADSEDDNATTEGTDL